MAKSGSVDNQYTKVTHNTQAFEEAILASVRAASTPAQVALAQAKFEQAKALLVRVLAYSLAIILLIIFIWFVIFIGQKAYYTWQQPKTIISDSISTNNSDVKNISDKEIELRSIVNETISTQSEVNKKSTRDQIQEPQLTNNIIESSGGIGNPISKKINEISSQNTITNEPEIVENMVVGPAVQTLTVFNTKDITLFNGQEIELVAGHRYSNNSATTRWREGYCYADIRDGTVNISIYIATKAGANAAYLDSFMTEKEIKMLGGKTEVQKLRKLCPWLS